MQSISSEGPKTDLLMGKSGNVPTSSQYQDDVSRDPLIVQRDI